MNKLNLEFFKQDALQIAPDLLGKILVRKFSDGNIVKSMITETEAYRGEEDLACHASKGKTERTRIMYEQGGHLYIYLIYGMYYMLNIVTGNKLEPQGVLIRGIEGFDGPGKLTRALQIDKSFYGEDITRSNRIWVEDNKNITEPHIIHTSPRINVDYAGNWAKKPWRFYIKV